MMQLVPLGDRALLATFANETDAIDWQIALAARSIRGVVDLVLAYRTVAVYFDPERVDGAAIEQQLLGTIGSPHIRDPARVHDIPVLYDGEDLLDVSTQAHLTIADTIKNHIDSTYNVFALGFQPGFPYAGYLRDPLKSIPRRQAPRLRVPSGSVAIAAGQTGIYPAELPGGWNLIGRTPLTIVDLRTNFFPIRAGDQLRFVPIDLDEFQRRLGERLA